MRRARDPIERFVLLLADTHPDYEFMFLHGGCYHLHLILKSLWPEAELWYQPNPGHVWSKIGARWYDIRGRRKKRPKGAHRRTAASLGRPDRWKHRLALVIDGIAAAEIVVRDMKREKSRGRSPEPGRGKPRR